MVRYGNPYIICGRKPSGHLTSLSDALKRALTRAGLENIRVHDLRRTVGSWLAHRGCSLHLIGDVLNHRDPKTTAGYAYFQTQQRREALSNHADKVLALGAAHLRPAPPQTIVAESLLSFEPNMSPDASEAKVFRHRHYFRREGLYELVWTAPIYEVAARLGVSDVALAKLCRRANIPIPARGYWARVDAGQSVHRTELLPAPAGLPELLRIRGQQPSVSEYACGEHRMALEQALRAA